MALYETIVGSLTAWQRNQWARAGYPGMQAHDAAKVQPFYDLRRGEPMRPVTPPVVAEFTVEERIFRLHNAGHSQRAIAAQLGVTKDVVYRRLKKLDTAAA